MFENKNLHNYLSGFLVKASILVAQFFLIPVYISQLGFEKYGEWLILTAIPNYLLMSDLGLTQTVINEICKYITFNEFRRQNLLFKSTVSFLIVIGLVLIAIFFLVELIVNVNEVLGLSEIKHEESVLIIGMYIVNISFFLIFRLIIGYYKAMDKFFMHEYVLSITYGSDFIFTLLILIFGLPLYSIPLSMLIIRIVVFVLVNLDLRRYDFYKLSLTINFKPVKKILPVSIRLSLFTLGYAILLQGNTLVVGLVLGSATVVVFNTIRTLVNSIKAFVSIFYLPTMPEFSILMAKKMLLEVKTKLNRVLKKSVLITMVLCLFVYIFRDFIFTVWLKQELNYTNDFFVFMLMSIFIQTIWNSASMLPLSINSLNKLSLFPVICLSVLLFQFFTIEYTGLKGVGISLFVLDLIMVVFLLKIVKELLDNVDKKEILNK